MTPVDFRASNEWFRTHAAEYRNQWVAVKDGNLLGVAPTLKELHEKIGAEGKSLETVIVKVLPDYEEWRLLPKVNVETKA